MLRSDEVFGKNRLGARRECADGELRERCTRGEEVLDLTVSNPTAVRLCVRISRIVVAARRCPRRSSMSRSPLGWNRHALRWQRTIAITTQKYRWDTSA